MGEGWGVQEDGLEGVITLIFDFIGSLHSPVSTCVVLLIAIEIFGDESFSISCTRIP